VPEVTIRPVEPPTRASAFERYNQNVFASILLIQYIAGSDLVATGDSPVGRAPDVEISIPSPVDNGCELYVTTHGLATVNVTVDNFSDRKKVTSRSTYRLLGLQMAHTRAVTLAFQVNFMVNATPLPKAS
jgi:hypothetical protein